MNRGILHSRRHYRNGLTLVELLVVVTILVMLVGVTIPLMKSVRSGNQLEAATRKIESVMNAAKALAITNGRPAGIVFIRDEINPAIAYEVALAESPTPYAGEITIPMELSFFPIPKGHVRFPANGPVRSFRPVPSGNSNLSDPTNDQSKWFVRPGDTIRFNFKGKHFLIREVNGPYAITLDEETGFSGTKWLEFQIFRAPRRTLAAPVQLPAGAFVKLSSCGMTVDRGGVQLKPGGNLFSNGDVVLSFDPTGRMRRVFRGSPTPDDEQLAANLFAGGWENTGYSTFQITGPIRIDLGDGSPLTPTNAHRLVINNREDRNSKAILSTQLN